MDGSSLAFNVYFIKCLIERLNPPKKEKNTPNKKTLIAKNN